MAVDYYMLLRHVYANRPIRWKQWHLRRKVLQPGVDGCLRRDQIERRKKLRRRAKSYARYETWQSREARKLGVDFKS